MLSASPACLRDHASVYFEEEGTVPVSERRGRQALVEAVVFLPAARARRRAQVVPIVQRHLPPRSSRPRRHDVARSRTQPERRASTCRRPRRRPAGWSCRDPSLHHRGDRRPRVPVDAHAGRVLVAEGSEPSRAPAQFRRPRPACSSTLLLQSTAFRSTSSSISIPSERGPLSSAAGRSTSRATPAQLGVGRRLWSWSRRTHT
jgi:hypothetical protein